MPYQSMGSTSRLAFSRDPGSFGSSATFEDGRFAEDTKKSHREAAIVAHQARIDAARLDGLMEGDESKDDGPTPARTALHRCTKLAREGEGLVRSWARGYTPVFPKVQP